MMSTPMEKILLDLKARQQAGEHMPCPRCGKDACRRKVTTMSQFFIE